MIWVAGEIVPDDALCISVLDRTFEHGLGLFETLRTWGGRPTLLERHLGRLGRSSRALGLPIDESALPGRDDVARLLEADGASGDVSLRITLSGGRDDGAPGTLWMRSRPLPPPIASPGATIRSTWQLAESDLLARFKTLNYWSRRIVFERARRAGFDEDIATTADGPGIVLEGSRTNVFLVVDGGVVTPKSEELRPRIDPTTGIDPAPWNPPTDVSPFLPGIMRSVVLERATALAIPIAEEPLLSLGAMVEADEVFLTNSGRGIIPVARYGPHHPIRPEGTRHYDAPGPVTRRLMADLDAWLRSEDAR